MNSIDFKSLSYAIAVSKYGSVTKASQNLYVAQPNLSRAVRDLEKQLGFELFIRTKHGMVLTEQGACFLNEAELVLSHLEDTAKACRKNHQKQLHFSCVPSSMFMSIILNLSKDFKDYAIQCEEYYNCISLFDNVARGFSDVGFLLLGKAMKSELLSYLTSRELDYHYLSESPAYMVVNSASSLCCHETVPPTIDFKKALMMLNVNYFEPIGIKYRGLPYELPKMSGTCRGVGRAGNLDMLETIDNLIMLSCPVHSRILTRNHLLSIPCQPGIPVYEYGYIIRKNQEFSPFEKAILRRIACEIEDEVIMHQ